MVDHTRMVCVFIIDLYFVLIDHFFLLKIGYLLICSKIKRLVFLVNYNTLSLDSYPLLITVSNPEPTPENFLSLMLSEFRWWMIPLTILLILVLCVAAIMMDSGFQQPFLYDVSSE